MLRPLIYSDIPDPDVIRVGDTYYMVSTTMHMFPGGDIYRSKDLIKWELCCHMYDRLDETPAQKLQENDIYGKGMWAACIRYHEGAFHVFFVCNDTHKTYHFTSVNPEGPWKWNHVEGFYHDCSVLFENGRVFVVHGNRTIHLTELSADLTGPLEGGLNTVLIEDEPQETMMLGFEGTHFYKINGRYYLFFIHWPTGGKRTEACYVSDCITGPYTGGDVLCDDMGFMGQGVAQGGIVDTADGKWKGVLFQDRGALGRVPVLCDVTWQDDYPRFEICDMPEENDADICALYSAHEDFTSELSPMWQFNHQPSDDAYTTGGDGLTLSLKHANDMEHARNTLTQRAFGPACNVSVKLDVSRLKPGGRAGLGLLQGCFAGLFVEKTKEGYALCLEERIAEKRAVFSDEGVTVTVLESTESPVFTLGMNMDFRNLNDTVSFTVNGRPVGNPHQLQYRLDHFMGARIALYGYDTISEGSKAVFTDYNCGLIR